MLDFGLAKAMAVDSSPSVVALSPTITSPAATAMGTIMGTAAYMSPEQARGRAVDKRSDIWAFGAVLYEMLTGRRAFDGEDVSYTLANILKGEPDWSALPPDTPPAIERVLRRCLTKDPRFRTHDVADVRIELDERRPPKPSVHVAARGRPGPLKSFERMAWLGVALALAAIAGFALWRGRAPEPVAQPVIRFQVPHPTSIVWCSGRPGWPCHRVRPVARRYTSRLLCCRSIGKGALYFRALDSLEPRSCHTPRTVVSAVLVARWPICRVLRRSQTYRLDVAIGRTLEVCAFAGNARGGPGARQAPSSSRRPTHHYVARAVGRREADTVHFRAQRTPAVEFWPSFLPDGRLSCTRPAREAEPGGAVYVAEVGKGSSEKVGAERYAGGLCRAGVSAIWKRRASLSSGVRLPDRAVVRRRGSRRRSPPYANAARPASSRPPGSTLAYRSGIDASNQFTWVDRKGSLRYCWIAGRYRTSALSPDGRRLVYTDIGDSNLKILDLQTWDNHGSHIRSRHRNGAGMVVKRQVYLLSI